MNVLRSCWVFLLVGEDWWTSVWKGTFCGNIQSCIFLAGAKQNVRGWKYTTFLLSMVLFFCLNFKKKKRRSSQDWSRGHSSTFSATWSFLELDQFSPDDHETISFMFFLFFVFSSLEYFLIMICISGLWANTPGMKESTFHFFWLLQVINWSSSAVFFRRLLNRGLNMMVF